MHRGIAIAALGVLGVLAVGCQGADDRPAAWGYISPAILQPTCATGSCHNRAAAAAGLDFSDPHRGYASLTRLWIWVIDPERAGGPGCGTVDDGLVVCEHRSRPLVTPYDPDASRLIAVLRARNAPRMPPDRPLPEADIRLIERWILAGAKEHEGSAGDAGQDLPEDVPSDGSAPGDTNAAGDASDAPGASDALDASDALGASDAADGRAD